MEKQLLLALALSICALFAFRYYQAYCNSRMQPANKHSESDSRKNSPLIEIAEQTPDYGKIAFLARPLSAILKKINIYTGNYGVSIIIMTFLLNILLFPIRLCQMLSMKKMAALQPRVRAIQEKYKKYKTTDPKRMEMNREIAELYKDHGVNPLGGCLPIMLQFPFLYSMNSLLNHSLEFRRAPFIGWIRDLSVKDPLYILPILMGASTLISQAMYSSASGGDAATTRMMLFVLPVVLTFFFLNYSSGLNLYFLSSNCCQIGLQKLGERYLQRKQQ